MAARLAQLQARSAAGMPCSGLSPQADKPARHCKTPLAEPPGQTAEEVSMGVLGLRGQAGPQGAMPGAGYPSMPRSRDFLISGCMARLTCSRLPTGINDAIALWLKRPLGTLQVIIAQPLQRTTIARPSKRQAHCAPPGPCDIHRHIEISVRSGPQITLHPGFQRGNTASWAMPRFRHPDRHRCIGKKRSLITTRPQRVAGLISAALRCWASGRRTSTGQPRHSAQHGFIMVTEQHIANCLCPRACHRVHGSASGSQPASPGPELTLGRSGRFAQRPPALKG